MGKVESPCRRPYTVGELIEKLQKLPKDAKVVIPNYDLYENGTYAVTRVVDFGHVKGLKTRFVGLDTSYATCYDDLIADTVGGDEF